MPCVIPALTSCSGECSELSKTDQAEPYMLSAKHRTYGTQVFYPFVLFYMIAAFLQGGAGTASMGMLNNLRQYLWIPITQDAYRSDISACVYHFKHQCRASSTDPVTILLESQQRHFVLLDACVQGWLPIMCTCMHSAVKVRGHTQS